MYDKFGALNHRKMGDILEEVKNVIHQLNPEGGRASLAKIDDIIKTLTQRRGPELYDALKQLSFIIKRSSDAPEMQALSATIFQMARAHNYQLGISNYDNAARTIGQRVVSNNPNIDTRSLGYVSDSTALEIRGAAKFGAQVANAEPATVSAGLSLGISRSVMATNDLDTGSLLITTGQASGKLSLDANVGKIANNALGTGRAQLGGSATRGWLTEGTTVQEVIDHKVMHDREGGDSLTRSMQPGRQTLRARANLSTRGVSGGIAAAARSVIGKVTDGRFADGDRVLNTHKLVKGAVLEGYLYGEDSLLAGISACDSLRRQLESAYAGSAARSMPSGLKPVVGTGDWIDVSGSAAIKMGLLDVQAGDYVKLRGLDINGGLSYNHRWLPYQLWMAPHAALDTLADRNIKAKQALLQRVKEADPSVTPYLDSTRSLPLQNLSNHMDQFEKHAMNLLAAQGILRGYAHTPLSLRPPRALFTHAEKRFDKSLTELKNLFYLTEDECNGVEAHSDKLEGLLARCWNRLSLALAQAPLRSNAPPAGELEELARRIERPNILMAPDHLYHAATLQMDKTFLRSRVVGNVSLALLSATIGNQANQAGLSLGTVSGSMTLDRVKMHPNLVRNGDFVTFDLTAQHPLNVDIVHAAPQAIANAIAERLQSGGDKREMSKLDRTTLLASLSEAYLTLGSDAASAALTGTQSVQRQFEVGAHRSSKDEPWRLAYIQASNIKNTGIGASGDGGVVLGVGGSVGASAMNRRSDNLVMPPILGSAASVHILQSPRFAQALLKQENGQWQLDLDRLAFDKLRNTDAATMYFSNDTVLDMLDLLHKLKTDDHVQTGVLGSLARLEHNATQFEAFQESGLSAEELREYIDDARKKTEGLRMAERLKHFTDTPEGRQLLQEYGSGILQFAAMKSRASLPYAGAGDNAMEPSVLTATEGKKRLEMPQVSVNRPFDRNSVIRQGMRRTKVTD